MKISSLGIFILGMIAVGCNSNLDTKKVVPQTTPQLTQLKVPVGSSSPSPTPSASPAVKTSPSPAPSATASPLCSTANQSFSQESGDSLVQWVAASPEISSTSLTAAALIGLRLNQDEGLYLSVITDSSNNSAIGLIHCDSKSPTSPKVMSFAWMNTSLTGINGGNDPSEVEDSSSATNCPDATSSALLKNIGKSLPPSISGALEVTRVRSNASESLYFVAAKGPNNQLVAGLLHCDEKTSTQLDVLGIASSTSKGINPAP
jgi:hypothetical protein